MFQNQTRRWIDNLDNFVESYNESTHSGTGKAPNDVTFENSDDVVNRLFHGVGRYKSNYPMQITRRKFLPGWYTIRHLVNKTLTVHAVTMFQHDNMALDEKRSIHMKFLSSSVNK